MADVRVFVGSTCADLIEDLRPHAIRAVREAEGTAVVMETWLGDHDDPAAFCKLKVERDSSHYIGIFAYRYGWVPDGQALSITELEYEWAGAAGKTRRVFLPDPSSALAAELEKRAASQSDEESERQTTFRKRVMAALCSQFQDDAHLASRVATSVMQWRQGGLLERARRPSRANAIEEEEVLAVGGMRQLRALENAFEMSAYHQTRHHILATILSGPAGSGHDSVTGRFIEVVAGGNKEPARLCVALSPLWRDSSMDRLLNVLSTELQVPPLADVAALAAELQARLNAGPVVLLFKSTHRHPGGVQGWVDGFWEPLAAGLAQPPEHPLVVIAQCDSDAGVAGFDMASDDEDAFDPSSPVLLPALAPIGWRDIAPLLRRRYSNQDSRKLAEALVDETGGLADLVHDRLRNPDTWTL